MSTVLRFGLILLCVGGCGDSGSDADTGLMDGATIDQFSSDQAVSDQSASDLATSDQSTTDGNAADQSPGDMFVGPVPTGCVIEDVGSGFSGAAPLTVHVNALAAACQLGSGTVLTARYQWNFDDTAGSHNQVVGFGGAHTYDTPGSYNITLTITNDLGGSVTLNQPVTVSSNNRPKIYVSNGGNDGNDGSTMALAVKTVSRAAQLLGDNVEVLFRRGDVFDNTSGPNPGSWFSLSGRTDVVFGAYGTGDRPKLVGPSNYPNYSALFDISTGQQITIQDLELTASAEPQPTPTDAFRLINGVRGVGGSSFVTVRRCHFDNVGAAIIFEAPSAQGPKGLFAENNTAEVIGTYFFWGQGSDHTLMGNTVAGSIAEHNIRLYSDRVYIQDNDLTEDSKTTISAAGGNHAYIRGNTLSLGRVRLGYVAPDSNYRWIVFESNRISGWTTNSAINHFKASDHVYIRNNLILGNANGIRISATAEDVWVVNNTHVNMGDHNGFLQVRNGNPPGAGLHVLNNLYVQPTLASVVSSPAYNTRTLDVSDSLAGITFGRNVWQMPQSSSWCNSAHYVEHPGGQCSAWRTPAQWLSLNQVSDDTHESTQLDAAHRPQAGSVATTYARPVAGIFDDLDGNVRPAGAFAAGALE